MSLDITFCLRGKECSFDCDRKFTKNDEAKANMVNKKNISFAMFKNCKNYNKKEK